jgi:hyperosmotically inducible protein
MRLLASLFAMFALLFAFAASALYAQVPVSKNKLAQSEEKGSPTLTRQIRHQLIVLPFYSVFDFISFSIDGNKVTLTGQVLRHTLKDNAEAEVKALEGVDTVVNQIEVLPPSPSDDELRRALYRAIYEDSTLQHYATEKVPPIHIIVKNGHVALEGSVDSSSDKARASLRASDVADVLVLRNNLVVQSKQSAAE